MSSRRNKFNEHEVAPRGFLFAAIAFSLLFASMGFYKIVESLLPWTWRSVDCVVMEYQLTDHADRDIPFAADVLFAFEWQGQTYRSKDLGIDGWVKADHGITFLRSLEDQNFRAKAYLPTGEPDRAVLLRPEPKWGGIAFMIFGLGVSWILLAGHRHRHAATAVVSRKIAPAVALLFGGCGIFLLANLSLPSWIGYARMQQWDEVPATIVWSKHRLKNRDQHTHHRADICYEYEHAGRTWRNNRLSPGVIHGGASSRAVRDLVQAFPAGMKTTCRIHPSDPAQSYLITDLSWQILFTLFPLPFLFVGYLCLRSLWKKS